jgi:putative ABC transport system ATP-binding protein
MNSADLILQTRDLSRKTAGGVIVDRVSIEVRAGDTLAVVGPSGAGKSSFLRLINRLDEPSGGTVFFKGLDYLQIPARELRCKIGMVMQQPNLFLGSVADNLRYGPNQRGETLPDSRIEDLLCRVDLAGFGERDVSQLSGGEAQRVSMARTLANSPELLLLDEPTSALDPEARREVERLITEVLREQGIPYLIVTHDAEQAVRMAERVMLMEGGRMVQIGPAEEVLNASRYV